MNGCVDTGVGCDNFSPSDCDYLNSKIEELNTQCPLACGYCSG